MAALERGRVSASKQGRVAPSARGRVTASRREFLGQFSAALLCLGAPQAFAGEADYPSRPITLIVPWPPGGTSDSAMRAFAQIASRHLKQNIVIENKPGAGGTLAPATMARLARPDGYTLTQIPGGIFRQPAMRKTNWDPNRDFSYISRLGGYMVAIVVRADSPLKTFADLIAFAKANPKALSYGSTGIATANHLGMEAVALQAGVEFNHVPFKGSADSLSALLGGHVMAVSSESAGTFIDSARVRALAVCGEYRVPRWPDVPTLIELGYDVVSNSPYGIAGPAGMDPKLVQFLDSTFKKVLEDPEFLKALAQFDMTALYQNTADYRQYTVREQVESRKLVEALGLVEK